ncbi:MAG: sulfurtransferase TusA family protein [Gammaproteobacteria bacterium]|nr:sulfurtransferase TusA family protein [Gammaproteobacteria bacterium]
MADFAQTLNEDDFDVLLDVTGMNCPMPVLKSKAALAHMNVNQVLKVIATHPDSQKEFPVLGRMAGLELLDSRVDGERFIYFLKKTI